LTGAVAAGSVEAWHEFLGLYAGLVYRVVRRFLLAEDEDEVRTVYVDVLKSLYDGGIADYRGTALVSSWLFVYTRSHAMDYYRKRFGRERPPRNIEKLGEYDRKVLELYFVEKLPLEIVVSVLGWCGMSTAVDEIVLAVQRIEKTLTRRYLDKLDNEYQAQRYNLDSGRALRYLLDLRVEYEEKTSGNRPDRALLENEARETAHKVRSAIASLDKEERRVLRCRYQFGWTARRIARELKLKSQRQAFYRIDKALNRLRGMLGDVE
jgi:RNA polymerase sigma factor (sigma-70 family)